MPVALVEDPDFVVESGGPFPDVFEHCVDRADGGGEDVLVADYRVAFGAVAAVDEVDEELE